MTTLLACALTASIALNLWQYLSGLGGSVEEYEADNQGADEILTTQEKWAARGHPNP